MGWFDEQIKLRKQRDDKQFEESFLKMANAVSGDYMSSFGEMDIFHSNNEIERVIKYLGGKVLESNAKLEGWKEILDYQCRPNGIMHREIRLEGKWFKDSVGPVLASVKDSDEIVALLPNAFGKYYFYNKVTGKKEYLNNQNCNMFDTYALCFYKPFPLRKISIKDMVMFSISQLCARDFVIPFIFGLFVTGVGMISPWLQKFLIGTVLKQKQMSMLFSTMWFMVCMTLTSTLFSTYKSLISAGISTKVSLSVSSATMMRIMSLKPSFFQKYSSGEVASRSDQMSSICQLFITMILETGLTSLLSFAYIGQIMVFAPVLVVPSLIMTAITIAFSIITTFGQMKISKQQMELSAKEYGMNYAVVSGISKIKLTGSEKRAFSRWADLYAKEAKLSYNPPIYLKYSGIISYLINLVGTLVMYVVSINGLVAVEDYYAFNASYGMVAGAFTSLAGITLEIANIKPVFDMIKPILDAEPEVSENKQVVRNFRGLIELNNVTFRYSDDMPVVIDNLSLKINPGEYLAIVGKTGCGKSTLVRLLLGFEQAKSGSVMYDNRDINSLDIKSLRKKMGVVLQNGKLFNGSIFENIIISAPDSTMDEAWEAARIAGFDEDIRNMPMGMHTVISEGGGGISGGQKQRLMIARAVVGKPKILIFDEATSALDNITQKKVSQALDEMNCTRIVVAHRLSTIKNCDRIVLIENGRIVEDGKYDELILQNGRFAELVARQQLDLGNKVEAEVQEEAQEIELDVFA